MKPKLTTNQAIAQILRKGWAEGWQVQDALLAGYGIMISESSTTARIRELRSEKFGAHNLQTRRADKGKAQFEYRIARRA